MVETTAVNTVAESGDGQQ